MAPQFGGGGEGDVLLVGAGHADGARILAADPVDAAGRTIPMAHPAYDQAIKASHIFNLLDARGVISVTERQAYIGRVRALAKACADLFVTTEAAQA